MLWILKITAFRKFIAHTPYVSSIHCTASARQVSLNKFSETLKSFAFSFSLTKDRNGGEGGLAAMHIFSFNFPPPRKQLEPGSCSTTTTGPMRGDGFPFAWAKKNYVHTKLNEPFKWCATNATRKSCPPSAWASIKHPSQSVELLCYGLRTVWLLCLTLLSYFQNNNMFFDLDIKISSNLNQKTPALKIESKWNDNIL